MKPKSTSEPRYCFGEQEPLPDGTRRILCEQLAQATSALSDHGISLEEAVHEARRCLKRTRSILRLVRFAIPVTYTLENERLRTVGRALSELRDSHALIETLRDLEKEHANEQKDGSHSPFASARRLLRRREEQIARQITENKSVEGSVAQLRKAEKNICHLNFRKVNLKGVLKSVGRSVKRGKKAFAAAQADPDAEKFHDWRKRAKDLRFQLSVLSELRPQLENYADSAKKLEQLLGEDHNLAVLASLLTEAHPEKADVDLLRETIGEQQTALREKAKDLGQQIYGDKRKAWKDRLLGHPARA